MTSTVMSVDVIPTSVLCSGSLLQLLAAVVADEAAEVVALVAAAVVFFSLCEQPAATMTIANNTDNQVAFLMEPPLLKREATSDRV
jgi:hypothetical protein